MQNSLIICHRKKHKVVFDMVASSKVKKPHKKHGFLKLMIIIILLTSVIALAKNLPFDSLEKIVLFERDKILADTNDNDTYDMVNDKSGFGIGKSDSETLNELYSLAEEDSRANKIIEDIDDYPNDMIKLFVKNSEARDFVLGYPTHQNDSETGDILKSELSRGIPHFLQWDERWGYHTYGSGVLGVTGCGPTCLSMVIVGLTGDKAQSPAAVSDFSEQNGFYVDGAGTSWDLMTVGAESFGLNSTVVSLSEDSMVAELEAGNPLILNVGPGDFTSYGHFIVITGYENGMFIVSDPNSKKLSSEGWYFSTLEPQIMNIWAYSLS